MNEQIELIKKILSTKDLSKNLDVVLPYKGEEYITNLEEDKDKLYISFNNLCGVLRTGLFLNISRNSIMMFNSIDNINEISNFSQLLQDYEEMDYNQFVLTYGKEPLRLSSELYDILNIFITDRSKQTPKIKGLFDVLNPIKFFKSFTKTKMP